MKKSDLKTGMWVENRECAMKLVLNNILTSENLYTYLCNYDDNLNHDSYQRLDIVKVYSGARELGNKGDLLWTRPEQNNNKENNKDINKIHEIVKDLYPGAISVEIFINSEGLQIKPSYRTDNFKYRMRTINGEWIGGMV